MAVVDTRFDAWPFPEGCRRLFDYRAILQSFVEVGAVDQLTCASFRAGTVMTWGSGASRASCGRASISAWSNGHPMTMARAAAVATSGYEARQAFRVSRAQVAACVRNPHSSPVRNSIAPRGLRFAGRDHTRLADPRSRHGRWTGWWASWLRSDRRPLARRHADVQPDCPIEVFM
jgi:hypothetical protein